MKIIKEYKVPFSAKWFITDTPCFKQNKYGVYFGSSIESRRWAYDANSIEEAKETIRKISEETIAKKERESKKLKLIQESKKSLGDKWLDYWEASE